MNKKMLQLGASKTKQLMKQLTLWLLHFVRFISNYGNGDQTKMETRKVKAMASVPHSYESVANEYKQQLPDVANHKVMLLGGARWTAGHTPIFLARAG